MKVKKIGNKVQPALAQKSTVKLSVMMNASVFDFRRSMRHSCDLVICDFLHIVVGIQRY